MGEKKEKGVITFFQRSSETKQMVAQIRLYIRNKGQIGTVWE